MSAFPTTPAAASPTGSVADPGANAAASRLLAEMQVGEVGRVSGVAVDEADAGRLKALGVCAGRTLRVVSAGNPLIVQVLNSRVGLSAALASQVTLTPCC